MSMSEKPTTPAAMNASVVSIFELLVSELAIVQDYKRRAVTGIEPATAHLALGMVGGFG